MNEIQLGEIASFINGDRSKNYPSGDDFVALGVPFISAADLTDNRVAWNTTSQIRESAYERLGSGKTQLGDLLYCLRGSLGKVARVKDVERACIASSLVIVRAKENVTQDYLYYVLSGPIGQHAALLLNNGSVQGNISVRDLRTTLVPLPPLEEQKAIVSILAALDDKIDLNRRLNETLEGMAQAIFRDWFVDFGPVRRKIAGATDPVAIMGGLTPDTTRAAELAALFPDALGDDDLPAGWGNSCLSDLAEQIAMGPFGSNIKVETFVESGVPVVSGGHLRGMRLDDTNYKFVSTEHADRLSRSNVQRGDIIFTHAGNIGQVAIIPNTSQYERYVISQRQFYMRCNQALISPWYILHFFHSPEGQHVLLANASQVGVPSIARPATYLRSIEICCPPKGLLDNFDAMAESLHLKAGLNLTENRALAETRDYLLPRLMSGEVRVSDAALEIAA